MKRPSPLVVSVIVVGALAILLSLLARFASTHTAGTEASSADSYAYGGAVPLMAGRGIAAPTMEKTAGQTAAQVDQKIIKTGSLDLAVGSVNETAAQLRALASGKGGYVQDASVNERADGTKFGSFTLRIPSKEFESIITEAKKLATLVKSETTAGQDVTEQYTDLQAQLRNARAQETEYLNILKKATSVQDILNVQQYLGSIRGTIESLQGRLQYLENVTSYATLSIILSEDTRLRAPSGGFRPLEDMRAAAQTLVLLAQALVTWLIWFVVIGVGILAPLTLVIFLVYRLIRRFVRKS